MKGRGPSARPPPAASEPPSIQTGGSMPSGPSIQSGVDPITDFGEVPDLSLVSSTGAGVAPVAGIPSPLGDADLPALVSSGVPTDPERSRDSVPSVQSIPSIPSLAETTSPLPIGVGAATMQGKPDSGSPAQPSPRPRSAPPPARPAPQPQPSPLTRTAQSAQYPPIHAMSPQQVAALQSAQAQPPHQAAPYAPPPQAFQQQPQGFQQQPQAFQPPQQFQPPQHFQPPQQFQPPAQFAATQLGSAPVQGSPGPAAMPPTFQPGFEAPKPQKYSSIPAEGTLDPRQMFDGSVGFGVQGASQPIMLSSAPPVLVDVSPHALVVETAGGYCDTVIPRNAKIPCEHTRKFATSHDMQTVAKIRVAQGEDGSFAANTYLGEVELSGIRPPAERSPSSSPSSSTPTAPCRCARGTSPRATRRRRGSSSSAWPTSPAWS
jgi:molecular chaperone DnaK